MLERQPTIHSPVAADAPEGKMTRLRAETARGETTSASSRRARFASLARQAEADLTRAALRMYEGDLSRAQDLVQDTLVRGYQAYVEGRFREGTNARAWLFRILTNGFINDSKRRTRWEAAVDLETLAASGDSPRSMRAAPGDQPDAALMSGALDEPLERALAMLSREARLCVILVDMQGLEYAEAASALGVPVGTVRSRLSRARLQLHAALAEYARERRLL
jgi:RNA polymerase sigma-70 factor (ECF subfamily)